MKTEFEMIDLGKLAYFLGMEFVTVLSRIILHKKKYAMEVLKRFNMTNCNASITLAGVGVKLDNTSKDDELVDPTLFKQLIGSLRYMCNNKPDISFIIGLVSRFKAEPRNSHFMVAKRILRYLKGTVKYSAFSPSESN